MRLGQQPSPRGNGVGRGLRPPRGHGALPEVQSTRGAVGAGSKRGRLPRTRGHARSGGLLDPAQPPGDRVSHAGRRLAALDLPTGQKGLNIHRRSRPVTPDKLHLDVLAVLGSSAADPRRPRRRARPADWMTQGVRRHGGHPGRRRREWTSGNSGAAAPGAGQPSRLSRATSSPASAQRARAASRARPAGSDRRMKACARHGARSPTRRRPRNGSGARVARDDLCDRFPAPYELGLRRLRERFELEPVEATAQPIKSASARTSARLGSRSPAAPTAVPAWFHPMVGLSSCGPASRGPVSPTGRGSA